MKSWKATLWRTLTYANRYPYFIAGAALAGAGWILAQLSIPWLMRGLVDGLASHIGLRQIAFTIGLLVTGAAATVALEGIQKYVFTYIGERILVDLRNQLVARLRSLPIAHLQKAQTGRIMSLVTSDAPAMAK